MTGSKKMIRVVALVVGLFLLIFVSQFDVGTTSISHQEEEHSAQQGKPTTSSNPQTRNLLKKEKSPAAASTSQQQQQQPAASRGGPSRLKGTAQLLQPTKGTTNTSAETIGEKEKEDGLVLSSDRKPSGKFGGVKWEFGLEIVLDIVSRGRFDPSRSCVAGHREKATANLTAKAQAAAAAATTENATSATTATTTTTTNDSKSDRGDLEKQFLAFKKHTNFLFPNIASDHPFATKEKRDFFASKCSNPVDAKSAVYYDANRVLTIENACLHPMGGLSLATHPAPLKADVASVDDVYSWQGFAGMGQYHSFLTKTKPAPVDAKSCYFQDVTLIVYPIIQRCHNIGHVFMRFGNLVRMVEQLTKKGEHVVIAYVNLQEGHYFCTDPKTRNRVTENPINFFAGMLGHSQFSTIDFDISDQDQLRGYFGANYTKDELTKPRFCFRKAYYWYNAARKGHEQQHPRLDPGYQFQFSLFGPRNQRDKETMSLTVNQVVSCFGLKRRAAARTEDPVIVLALRTGTRLLGRAPQIVELLSRFAKAEGGSLDVLEHTKTPPAEMVARMLNSDVVLGIYGVGIMWSLFSPPGSVMIDMHCDRSPYSVGDGWNVQPQSDFGGVGYAANVHHMFVLVPKHMTRIPAGAWDQRRNNWLPIWDVEAPPALFVVLANASFCKVRQKDYALKRQSLNWGSSAASAAFPSCEFGSQIAHHSNTREGMAEGVWVRRHAEMYTTVPEILNVAALVHSPKPFADVLNHYRISGQELRVLDITPPCNTCSRSRIGFYMMLHFYVPALKPMVANVRIDADAASCGAAMGGNKTAQDAKCDEAVKKVYFNHQAHMVTPYFNSRQNACQLTAKKSSGGGGGAKLDLVSSATSCSQQHRSNVVFLEWATLMELGYAAMLNHVAANFLQSQGYLFVMNVPLREVLINSDNTTIANPLSEEERQKEKKLILDTTTDNGNGAPIPQDTLESICKRVEAMDAQASLKPLACHGTAARMKAAEGGTATGVLDVVVFRKS